jgi:DNA invertase Pin-like site-specific DNA recombinase
MAVRVKTREPQATRVVGYCRVSLEKMANEGVSLAAQEAKLRAYAALYGLELVDVIVDAGVSAKTLDRPGLMRALERLRKGEADGLLIAKLDRLTRSVRDLGTLIEEHFERAALLSVAENIDTRSAAGRLVLNVLASVAQWEREAIGERTSAAMAHLAAEGRYTGGDAPYGLALRPDGQLVEVPAEQEVLAAARKLRAAGLSLRAVAAELAAAGKFSRTGRPLAAAQVARMVGA